MRMGIGATCCLVMASLTALAAVFAILTLGLLGVIEGPAMSGELFLLSGFGVLVLEIPREDKA